MGTSQHKQKFNNSWQISQRSQKFLKEDYPQRNEKRRRGGRRDEGEVETTSGKRAQEETQFIEAEGE